MSDESPALLKLKPKDRSAPAPVAAVETSPEPAKSEGLLSRFRLKPRMPVEEPATPTESPAAEAAVEMALAAPVESTASEPVDLPPALPAEATPVAIPPVPQEEATTLFAPKGTVVTPEAPAHEPPATLASVPDVAGSLNLQPRPTAGPKFPPPRGAKGRGGKPENRPAFKAALGVVCLLIFGIVAGGMYVGYRAFTTEPVPAESTPKAAAKVQPQSAAASDDVAADSLGGSASESEDPGLDAAPAAPSETATAAVQSAAPARSAPKSAAGRLIQQAKSAAAARSTDLPSLDDDLPAPLPKATPRVKAPAARPATVAVPPAQPSPSFHAWVANVQVSGVRRGQAARAVIDGRLMRQGEVVETNLGIVFVGVDPHQNLLLFRDASGVVVARKF